MHVLRSSSPELWAEKGRSTDFPRGKETQTTVILRNQLQEGKSCRKTLEGSLADLGYMAEAGSRFRELVTGQ